MRRRRRFPHFVLTSIQFKHCRAIFAYFQTTGVVSDSGETTKRTVVCLLIWPMNESEARVDFALIQTSLHLPCKHNLVSIKTASFTQQSQCLAAIQRARSLSRQLQNGARLEYFRNPGLRNLTYLSVVRSRLSNLAHIHHFTRP